MAMSARNFARLYERDISQNRSQLACNRIPCAPGNACLGQRRTRDKRGRGTRIAARSGFGASAGTLDAQELRFHGGGEGKPGRVSKKLGRNGKCFPPLCRRPATASTPG